MLFAIYATDTPQPHSTNVRDQHFDAHKEFLARAADYGVTLVMTGPLMLDDGVTPCGSLLVIEAADRATAEAFHHADPFYTAGLWAKTTLTAFVRRY